MNSTSVLRAVGASCLLVALTACGGGDQPAPSHSATPAAAGGARPQPPTNVQLTGNRIEVLMITNDKGNYFEPANFTVKAGDVVRFKLVTGVHNVSFPADSNKFAKWLPAPSILAQLPGQTIDIAMTFGSGEYFYQCDPHALLGMVGRITVED